MIDTLRFKIPLSLEVIEAIKLKCKKRIEKDNETGNITFEIYSRDIELGSFDYKTNIFLYEEDCIYLEFSAPKVFYGHNVYLLYPSIEPVLLLILNVMQKRFNVPIPHYSTWILQRLDICYSYKFKNYDEAYRALHLLDPFDMSRKTKNSRDTSFEQKGTTYTLKGYLKYDEYKKHDFKRLKKKDVSLAHDLLHESESVLRIELELKKKKLDSLFKKDITYKEINDTSILINILNDHIGILLKGASAKSMYIQEVIDKLHAKYKIQKALNLYLFFSAWNNSDPTLRLLNRKELKKLDPSSLSRKHKDLRLAGVGILNDTGFTNIDFTIPSEFVVNKENIVMPVCSKQLGLLMDS